MKLTISQIDKILWQGDADAVNVPGVTGQMTVLANHMPLITMLKQGTIRVEHKGKDNEEFPVTSGFMEVGKTETVILV